MKKLLAITLTLAVLLSLMSMATITVGAEEIEGDYEYELIDDGAAVRITKYTGAGSEVAIPSTIAGKPVISIGDEAFSECNSMTSIIIPKGVVEIGFGVFWGCVSLNSITIPDSVIYVDSLSFYQTAWYEAQPDGLVYVGKVAYKYKGDCPKDVAIKEGTLGIAGGAFSNCSALTNITIPNSVTNIGWDAFYGCESLKGITIPEKVTSIGGHAFHGCTSLTSIAIPASVTNIETMAFIWCSTLESVIVQKGNPIYHSADNCLIETASKTLIAGCNNSVIPADGSVTNIGEYAFDGCTSLTSITIPASVTHIGEGVFFGCDNLENLTVDRKNPFYYSEGNCLIKMETQTLIAGCNNSVIPANGSVTHIGNAAFGGHRSLSSVTIPDGVTNIGDSAFEGCVGLNSIIIPKSVVFVDENAFSVCDNLKTVFYAGTQDDRDKMIISDWNWALLDAAWVYEYQPPEEPSAPSDVSADAVPGDATGDGSVDMKDVLQVRKFIAGLSGTINETAADVNRDGSVDMKDVLLLRKFIAGLITTLG